MLHIVMIIIKFVGILFLCLLCFLILLGCALIFVPVRYEAEGSYLEKIEGKFRFSWFLHFLSVQASYAGEKTALIIKICGIPLRKKKKPETDKKQKKIRKDIKHKKLELKKAKEEEQHQSQEQESNIDKKVENTNTKSTENEKILSDDSHSEEELQENKTEHKKHEKEQHKESKINFTQKIKQIIEKPKKKIETLKQLKEKIGSFFQENDIKSVLGLGKSQVLIAFKHFRPRKLVLNLHFGFEDPSMTGIVLGILCILYPFYKNTMNIKPNFENKVLEGDFYCKGRIRFFHMMTIGFRLWKDKNFRKMIKNFIK